MLEQSLVHEQLPHYDPSGVSIQLGVIKPLTVLRNPVFIANFRRKVPSGARDQPGLMGLGPVLNRQIKIYQIYFQPLFAISTQLLTLKKLTVGHHLQGLPGA